MTLFGPVNSLVGTQIGGIHEGLLTTAAFVRPNARVYPDVYRKVRTIIKGLSAGSTRERTFVCVHRADVILQTISAAKRLSAHRAFVRPPFVGYQMRLNMALKVVRPAKRASTQFALVRSGITMPHDVRVKVALVNVGFVAKFACVWPVVGVRSKMDFQVVKELKAPVAEGAHVRPCIIVVCSLVYAQFMRDLEVDFGIGAVACSVLCLFPFFTARSTHGVGVERSRAWAGTPGISERRCLP